MNKVAGVLLLLLWSPLPAAPGSWQSPLAELRLAVAGRFYHSEPATPPPIAAGENIVRVGWRYRLPAGRRVQALRLRFRLPAGERRAVTVGAPRLTVEYR